MSKPTTTKTGIRDNRSARGSVADFLREKVADGADLSFVSAYFTIYAYEQLKSQLHRAAGLRFLFGEPSFVQGIDPQKKEQQQFRIENDKLQLKNVLRQRQIAKDCSAWISEKVDIRTVTREGFLHGKMYHVANNGVSEAILGSSNFTVRGLGLADDRNNIELNLIVDSNRDREELKEWFEEIWRDFSLVRDVKNEVLSYLEQLYRNNAPEFIYYKTLFHIFEHLLEDQTSLEDSLQRTSLFESSVWKALYDF
jgi:phosphatidylserine/phosphatidylglycerophosphate/cardiolipin synthase-like enzyme